MKTDFLHEFKEALQITSLTDELKIAGTVNLRLIALGHFENCSRCGGSGHYSYNQRDGSRCFKCNGRGKIAHKLTAKLLKEVKQQVEQGALVPYIEDQKNKYFARSAGDLIMKAWEGLGLNYNWMNAAQDKKAGLETEDARQSIISAQACEIYTRINDLTNKFTSGKNKGCPELAKQIKAELDAGLEKMKELKTLV